jgi:site-specific DNA-methyltransferase (adenine-specific)
VSPYYSEDGITIYHGDCREVLAGLPSGSADVVITDPPYGVNWESNRRTVSFGRISGDDGGLDVLSVLRESVRVLRGRRHIYAFGRWDFKALALGGVCELIWDKQVFGCGDVSLVWAPSHEIISFGVSANSAQRRGGTGNVAARLRRGSVLRFQRHSGVDVDDHPTEKPVDLLREFIESSSRRGELVLDPFAGVGSSLVAAMLEGRRAIGIEIEERYCDIAAKRLRQRVLPLGAA